MTITAKFASKCSECGGKIHAGDRIEWTKGAGAAHAKCAKPRYTANGVGTRFHPAKPRTPSFPDSAPEIGSHQISGRRTGRGDRRYEAGQTIHLPKVSAPGGGPDQHYYTVLSATISAPNEDNQEFDWREIAWVRAATDAEAAPVAARISTRDARAAELAAIRALFAGGKRLSEEDAGTVASEQSADKVVVAEGVHGSGREWIAFADAEHVVLVHGGHYDDYRVSASWLPRTPELEARIRALAAK